jgi:uncharacterized RDD family membrane protein YckC
MSLEDLRPAPADGPCARAPAGFLRRTAAAAIDALVAIAFVFVWSYVLVGLLGYRVDREAPGAADLPYFAVSLLFAWLYCAGLESGPRAATLGKRALGLSVRDRFGERPGFGRASLRFLARLLTVSTAMLGWLLILATPKRQALHDLLAGTTVVVDRPTRRS